MTAIPAKRRNIFIKKAFQGRFIIHVLLLILLSGLCSALLVYWLTGNDLQSQIQTAHINIKETWNRLGLSLLIGHIIAITVAGTLTVYTVLYALHKIAGPLYHFELLCKQISEGKLDMPIALREGDQLQDLAKAFAVMVENLNARQHLKHQQLATLTQQLEQLDAALQLNNPYSELLAQIEQTVEQLRNS